MTAFARTPTVLIAEPDPTLAELLSRLVRDVRHDAQVLAVADGRQVLDHYRQDPPDLLIAACELPGVGGLDLLREVRQRHRGDLPFFLLSDKVDASSVRAAVSLGPTAYLAKPFDVEDLLKRLRRVLPVAPTVAAPCDLAGYLAAQRGSAAGAPLLAPVQARLRLCLSTAQTDLAELERSMRDDPQLTARLIVGANSAAQQRGSPCQTLAQALARLGTRTSLNLALGLALERGVRLDDPLLVPAGSRLWRLSLRTAELAHWLALQVEADAERCYTAGLLHRLGDLSLLRTLQDWQRSGGVLHGRQVQACLDEFAAAYGGALRTRWRLPLELRQLIGAAYQLGGGVYSREALVMHLAAQAAQWGAERPFDALAAHKAARLLRLEPAVLKRMPEPSVAA
ncbi:response regulator [Pseudomonas sp. RIT-PI-AD]|uniref:response regulator n=1 Tax=Pseudomonas sp. RIT-PI-AD TaxID=3035294 RepID=UPI0021DAAA11|nr:response regulator [Pseudomonas sp. RIT-PI-AD]